MDRQQIVRGLDEIGDWITEVVVQEAEQPEHVKAMLATIEAAMILLGERCDLVGCGRPGLHTHEGLRFCEQHSDLLFDPRTFIEKFKTLSIYDTMIFKEWFVARQDGIHYRCHRKGCEEPAVLKAGGNWYCGVKHSG